MAVNNRIPRYIDAFDAALELALREIAALAHGNVVQRAPIDTGRLRESISAVVGNNAVIAAGSKYGDPTVPAVPQDTISIGSVIEYAQQQEDRGKRGFVGRGYFQRGLAATVPQMEPIISRQLRRLI